MKSIVVGELFYTVSYHTIALPEPAHLYSVSRYTCGLLLNYAAVVVGARVVEKNTHIMWCCNFFESLVNRFVC